MSMLPSRGQSNEDIPMREFLERILEERHRLYTVQFEEAKTAVNAALIAQKESTAFSFAASEKAIVKAEDKQNAYNAAHNDLSRKMELQYKEMLPHTEAMATFKAVDDRIEALKVQMALFIMRIEVEDKLKSRVTAEERLIERIQALEQANANLQGRFWAISVGFTLLSSAIAIALHFIGK